MATMLAADSHKHVLGGLGHVRRAYSPYGMHSSNIGIRTAFNGQLSERCTGHYGLGNGQRVYLPRLGCFTTPDRFSPFDRGGLSAYAYCLADPINRADPTGQYSVFTLLKTVVWLGKRTLTLLEGVTGLKRVTEATKWGSRIGVVGRSLGVPGAGALITVSNGVALTLKAAKVGNDLLTHARTAIRTSPIRPPLFAHTS